MEYDERTCTTAGEYREMGLAIPEIIPDCAWVPTHSVIPGKVKCYKSKKPDTIEASMEWVFTLPFNWVTVEFTLQKEGEE